MVSGCSFGTSRWTTAAVITAASLLQFAAQSVDAQPVQQPRVVVSEMFTATWCVYCPPVRQAQSDLFDQNPDQFFPIQVHAQDSYATTWGNQRNAFYNVTGFPTTVQDGTLVRVGQFGNATYVSDFNARKVVPTDVTLKIFGEHVSGLTFNFPIEVGLIAGGTPKTVRIHTVQVLDYYPNESGARNTFIQDASSSDVALTPGNVVELTKTFTFSGDSASNTQNIRVLVWAQQIGPAPSQSQIYQAAYTSFPFIRCDCPPGLPGCGDCNGNQINDECEIVQCEDIGCRDCNNNNVLDGCEFPLTDCNADGIADACQIAAGLVPDCNANGVPDSCDLVTAFSADCNANAIPDECDIAACVDQPECDDCNNNARPDLCDVQISFASESPNKSPLGTPTVQTHTFMAPPTVYSGDVTLTFIAKGDLSAASELVNIAVNGQAVGQVFEGFDTDCLEISDTIVLTGAQFANLAALNGGNLTVTMTPSTTVSPTSCQNNPANTYIRVKLSYAAEGASADDDRNGIPDSCEAPAGCPGDLNCDGLVSFTDIDLFVEALSYPGGAGWPNPACPWSNGDVNGDNDVTFADIDPFVAAIGAVCP